MKTLLLKRIRLTNWKSKNLDVTFSDDVTKISARNEVGKSSLQQAWNWLFTSTTYAGVVKNSNLFDNRFVITPQTPSAVVTAWISIDGVEYVIEKSAKAKFKRVRGSLDLVKDSSDEYSIKIDDIDVTQTQFEEWVSNHICDFSVLPLLLDGDFFINLCLNDKAKARGIVEMLSGTVDYTQLSGDYSTLLPRLDKYPPQQVRDQIVSLMRPIKRRLDTIPEIISDNVDFVHKLTDGIDEDKTAIDFNHLSNMDAVDMTNENIDRLIRISKQVGLIEVADSIRTRISELEQEGRDLADKFVSLSGDKACVDALIEEAIIMAANNINSRLDGFELRMFDIQKNGDKVPDCMVVDKQGVKYTTLSNSAKLRVKLQIQKMFMERFGVSLMQWIDEAAIFDKTHLPQPNGQICYLFAGDSLTLKIE